MYTVLMTVKLCKLNPRTWLLAYLQACCEAGNRAPADLRAFLPWTMTAPQLATMRACPLAGGPASMPTVMPTIMPTIEGLDTS